MTDKKIVFLGTPAISSYLLEEMIKMGFNIVAVVTKEDKPVGRKMVMTESPVASVARKYNIPCYKPHRLNKDHDWLYELKPDLLLTFAYGQIISTEVLGLCKYKPLNLHASLLPKYRGAAPIQYCLRNGDKETGISLMEMVKEMDAGDVYAVEKINIEEDDNYTSLCDKLQRLAVTMASKYLPLYFENKLEPVKQDESLVSFCPSIKKDQEKLILDQTPEMFVNQVRALSETPGGYLMYNDEKLKIYKASVNDDTVEHEVGTVIKAKKREIILQLSKGTVKLLRLQRPGKKILEAIDFNNGNGNLEGSILR